MGSVAREINTSGNLTVGARVSGAGLVKTGSGTMTMTSGTTNSPDTFGTLQVIGGALVLQGGNGNGSVTVTASGSDGISGLSSVFVEGGASLTLTNGFVLTSFDTPQVHNSGSITVDDSTWKNQGDGSVTGDIRIGYFGGQSTLTVQNGGNVMSDANIDIGSANNGVALLTVKSGSKVSAASTLTIYNGSSAVVDQGQLNVGALNSGTSSVAGVPTVSISDQAGIPSIVVGNNDLSSTFAGNIADYSDGAGSIEKQGMGTFTLSGNNSYSGGLVINEGTVAVAAGATLGASNVTVTFNNAGQSVAATLAINSSETIGSLQGSAASTANVVALNGSVGTRLSISQPVASAFIGTFQGPGQLALTGNGTLTLGGSGGTMGSLLIDAGTGIIDGSLMPGVAYALNLTSTQTGGVQDSVVVGGANQTGTLTMQGGATVTSGNFVAVDGAAGTGITVTGIGTTWSAGTQQTYIGVSQSGFVTVDNHAKAALGVVFWAIAAGTTGGLTVQNGAVVTSQQISLGYIGSTNGTVSGTGSMLSSTGDLLLGQISGTANLTISAGGSGSFAAISIGAGTGAVGNCTVTGSGSTLTSQGVLDVGINGQGTLTVSNGGAVTAPQVAAVGALSMLNISNGTVTAGALSGSGTVMLSDPAGGTALTLTQNVSSAPFSGAIADAAGGRGSIHLMSGTETFTGTTTYTGTTTVDGGATLIVQTPSLASSKVVANSGGMIELGTLSYVATGGQLRANAGGTIQYAGTTVTNALLFGPGTQVATVDGTNFIGSTLFNGAVLQANANTTLTGVTSGGAIAVATGKVLAWDGGTNTSAGSLTVNGSAVVDGLESDGVMLVGSAGAVVNSQTNLVLGGGSRTTVAAGGNVTLQGGTRVEVNGGLLVNNGVISGAVDVNYGGTAEGTGSYGVVNVTTGGAFLVQSAGGPAITTGTVTLGGTLEGNGAISGAVVAGSSSHVISPGAPGAGNVGTLGVGALTTNSNTELALDLVSPKGGSDLLAVNGNLTLGGGTLAILSQEATGPASLGYYPVISYSGVLTGSTSGIVLPAASGNVVYTLDTTHDAGFVDVHRGFIGDATDDGTVDVNDLNLVLSHLGTTTSSWSLGNFDGAATIDLTDLNDVLNRMGTSVPVGAVSVETPEPASLGVAGLGTALLIVRRRRQQSAAR